MWSGIDVDVNDFGRVSGHMGGDLLFSYCGHTAEAVLDSCSMPKSGIFRYKPQGVAVLEGEIVSSRGILRGRHYSLTKRIEIAHLFSLLHLYQVDILEALPDMRLREVRDTSLLFSKAMSPFGCLHVRQDI